MVNSVHVIVPISTIIMDVDVERREKKLEKALVLAINKEFNYEVDYIIAKRVKNGRPEYLVKWENWCHRDATWEPVVNFASFEVIDVFEKGLAGQKGIQEEKFLFSPTKKNRRKENKSHRQKTLKAMQERLKEQSLMEEQQQSEEQTNDSEVKWNGLSDVELRQKLQRTACRKFADIGPTTFNSQSEQLPRSSSEDDVNGHDRESVDSVVVVKKEKKKVTLTDIIEVVELEDDSDERDILYEFVPMGLQPQLESISESITNL